MRATPPTIPSCERTRHAGVDLVLGGCDAETAFSLQGELHDFLGV